MTRRWLFIDEQPAEAEKCVALLAETGELEIDTREPVADVGFVREAIEGGKYTGVLLDHALNEGSAAISYAGSTIAAFLRSEYPHLPVVVLSAKLAEPVESRRYRRTEDLFDLKLDKQDLATNADEVRRQLKALDDGYRTLNDILQNDGKMTAARSLLGIPADVDDDSERVGVARLLVEEGDGESCQVAKFLLQIALRLYGPLLDRRRAAVAAGLAPDENSEVDAFLKPAKYCGAFAELHQGGRYWREQMSELDDLPEALPRAKCVVCGGPASELCEKCERPVDGLHSLPVRRTEVANDMFLRSRLCAFCLGGELPEHLVIEGSYARMRDAIVAQAEKIQAEKTQ